MEVVGSFDFNMVWSALGGLVSLVVFVICTYFVVVKPAIDSILMVIGSFIHMITSLFYSVGMVILSNLYGMDIYATRWMYSIMGFINLIGSISFTAGLIILIINYVKLYKNHRFNN